MKRFRHVIGSVLNGGITADDPRYHDVALMRRVRVGALSALVLLAMVPPMAAFYVALGAPVAAAAVVATGVLGVFALLFARRRPGSSLGVHVALGGLTALLCFLLLCVGGIRAMGQGWVWVPAIIAGVLLGVRAALVYAALGALQVAGWACLESAGVALPELIAPQYRLLYTTSVQLLLGATHVGLVGAFLSARSQAEQELVATNVALAYSRNAAERAGRAKSEFLANMSHEIRTPINVVIGMIDMVLDSDLALEQRNDLGRARVNAISLLAIINDVLDSSKIEAGKMTIEVVDMDLKQTIEEAVAMLAPAAADKGLAFDCTMAADLPTHVRGDPVRLRQILVNLLGNAVKFTSAGSVAVEVRAGPPELTSHIVHFSVRDTGVGIAPDKLDTIFEPFEQGDVSTTRTYGGTGLGLAICTRLVTLMGGRIWVASEPGHGTTFHVTVRFESLSAPSRVLPAPATHAA